MATPKMQPFWWFKKPPCPSGEQIINGDFEDGETGWTFGSANSNISTAYAHSPTHSVFSYSDGTGFYQAISNLPVACVQSLTFWAISPHGTGTMQIKITYTDDTYTLIDYSHEDSWTQEDVTAQLEAGKTIKEVRFLSSTDNPTYIDDVSLIGTG